jgi:hypothetical protein
VRAGASLAAMPPSTASEGLVVESQLTDQPSHGHEKRF